VRSNLKQKGGDEVMKRIVIEWKGKKSSDSGKQSQKLQGMSHPGCCSQ